MTWAEVELCYNFGLPEGVAQDGAALKGRFDEAEIAAKFGLYRRYRG